MEEQVGGRGQRAWGQSRQWQGWYGDKRRRDHRSPRLAPVPSPSSSTGLPICGMEVTSLVPPPHHPASPPEHRIIQVHTLRREAGQRSSMSVLPHPPGQVLPKLIQ